MAGHHLAFVDGLLACCAKCSFRPVDQQVLLYACENDHAAVEKMKEELRSKVFVLPCMVDRICAARTIYSDRVSRRSTLLTLVLKRPFPLAFSARQRGSRDAPLGIPLHTRIAIKGVYISLSVRLFIRAPVPLLVSIGFLKAIRRKEEGLLILDGKKPSFWHGVLGRNVGERSLRACQLLCFR